MSANPVGLSDQQIENDSEAAARNALQQLGLPVAADRVKHTRIALEFFSGNMPGMPPATKLSFLRAMDLSKPVVVVDVKLGEHFVSYRGRGPLYGTFYSRPGRDPRRFGIMLDHRNYARFESFRFQANAALESTTAAVFHEARGPGGELQYIIPNSTGLLRRVRVSDRP